VLAIQPEPHLAAIVDFTFNLGAGRLQTSTLPRRINERDWDAARTEIRRWVYGGRQSSSWYCGAARGGGGATGGLIRIGKVPDRLDARDAGQGIVHHDHLPTEIHGDPAVLFTRRGLAA
jgi:hypothetical protein